MNVEKILAISGKPGVFELKIQTRSGFVAESLLDGKKITVGMKSNVSLLSEISMYTHSEEKPLVEILRAIAVKENEGPAISHKEDNVKLIAYFSQIVPDYDEDRVYPSDIKKVLNWYNMLQAKGMVSKEEPKVENAESVKEQVVEEVKAKKETAEKLKAKGLHVSFIGETAGEPAIVAEKFKTWLNERKVLIPSSEQSNRSIAQTLPTSQLEELIIYRTVAKPLTIEPCAVNVFTSPSNFLSFIQKNTLESSQTIIAWGKTTEKAIRNAGYAVNSTLTFASEEELVEVLTSRV
jgi:post-segregation antitoxin (ccd killing protein)